MQLYLEAKNLPQSIITTSLVPDISCHALGSINIKGSIVNEWDHIESLESMLMCISLCKNIKTQIWDTQIKVICMDNQLFKNFVKWP